MTLTNKPSVASIPIKAGAPPLRSGPCSAHAHGVAHVRAILYVAKLYDRLTARDAAMADPTIVGGLTYCPGPTVRTVIRSSCPTAMDSVADGEPNASSGPGPLHAPRKTIVNETSRRAFMYEFPSRWMPVRQGTAE